MSKLNTTSSSLNFQPQIIIPFNYFSSSYDSVLNSIDGLITSTERKLLSFFAFKAYRNGEIYPVQKTIARKLNIGIRQVKRIIQALIRKGFILVTPPSLIERHLYGKGNRYHFLYHEIYATTGKMSPEMSPEKLDSTFNNKKVIKKNKAVSFDPCEFVKRHLDNGKHALSLVDALNAITSKIGYIRHPEAYGNKIVDIQSGNYYSLEHQQQQPSTPTVQESKTLLEKIGFSPKTIKTGKKHTQNELHQQLRELLIE